MTLLSTPIKNVTLGKIFKPRSTRKMFTEVLYCEMKGVSRAFNCRTWFYKRKINVLMECNSFITSRLTDLRQLLLTLCYTTVTTHLLFITSRMLSSRCRFVVCVAFSRNTQAARNAIASLPTSVHMVGEHLLHRGSVSCL